MSEACEVGICAEKGVPRTVFSLCFIHEVIAWGWGGRPVSHQDTPYPELPCPWDVLQLLGKPRENSTDRNLPISLTFFCEKL